MTWEKVDLSDIIAIKKGKNITKKSSKAGLYPVILGGREPAYFINKYNHTGKAIVVSRSGASAGYVSFWNEPIFVTDGFLIEPKETVNIDFLYYLMKVHEEHFIGLQGGSAIPHVTPRTIGAVSVLVPPIEMQNKIADILSAYDDLIENNQKQIKLLEEAAQRLYKEWFVDLRFPGHEDTEIVDGVPEGWKKATVVEISSVLRRGISPKYNDESDLEVINQKCIRQTVVSFDEARRQEKKFSREMSLRDSDTVICSTGTGTLGRVGQIFGNYPQTTFDSHVTLVRAKSEFGKQYLFQHLKSRQSYLMGMGKGSTNQQELSKGVIENLDILLPSEVLQTRFEALAQPIHDKINVVNAEIVRLQEARDRLLPKLMSGEIEL